MATEAYEDGNLVMAAQQFGAAVSTFRGPSVPTEHLTRALLGHAAVLNDQRRFAQASATIDEAVSILSSEVAEGRIARDVMGRARDLQGGILAEMGELERAMSCGYDAVRILGEVDSGPGASPQTRRDHGKALSNLAGLTQRVGRISEAVRLSRRAVEIFEELRLTGTLQPDDATYARVILGDARIVATASGPEPALAELNRALEELHRIAGLSAGSKRTMEPDLATALSFHSVLHRQLGDYQAALDSGQRAVESYLALADLRPAFLPDLATSLVNVANLHLDLGQAAIAVPDAQRAVHVLTKLVAEAEDTSQPVPATLTRFLARAQETLARARTSAWGG
jgi:tetratricopeptide (TPR) repeat protein